MSGLFKRKGSRNRSLSLSLSPRSPNADDDSETSGSGLIAARSGGRRFRLPMSPDIIRRVSQLTRTRRTTCATIDEYKKEGKELMAVKKKRSNSAPNAGRGSARTSTIHELAIADVIIIKRETNFPDRIIEKWYNLVREHTLSEPAVVGYEKHRREAPKDYEEHLCITNRNLIAEVEKVYGKKHKIMRALFRPRDDDTGKCIGFKAFMISLNRATNSTNDFDIKLDLMMSMCVDIEDGRLSVHKEKLMPMLMNIAGLSTRQQKAVEEDIELIFNSMRDYMCEPDVLEPVHFRRGMKYRNTRIDIDKEHAKYHFLTCVPVVITAILSIANELHRNILPPSSSEAKSSKGSAHRSKPRFFAGTPGSKSSTSPPLTKSSARTSSTKGSANASKVSKDSGNNSTTKGAASASSNKGAASVSSNKGATSSFSNKGSESPFRARGSASASSNKGLAIAPKNKGAAGASSNKGPTSAYSNKGSESTSRVKGSLGASSNKSSTSTSSTKSSAGASSNKGAASASSNKGAASASSNKGSASASSNKGSSSASSNKGVTSASSNKGAASVSSNKGAGSASSNKGSASASSNKGSASASSNKGSASAFSNKGAGSASSNKSSASASSNKSAASASSTKSSASASGNKGAASASGNKGSASASGTKSSASASSNKSSASASSNKGSASASSNKGSASASSNKGSARASSNKGAESSGGALTTQRRPSEVPKGTKNVGDTQRSTKK